MKHALQHIKRDTNKWSMYTLTIVAFIALPIITIAISLWFGPGESWLHLLKTVIADYTLNSLALIVGCTILTTLFGVSCAWLVSRYTFPLRRMLEWLLILPLAIPSYITAYAYAGIFDYDGWWQQLTSLKLDIMNLYGLILVLSISLFPYVYVSTRAVFLFQSNRLIEASKLLGASDVKTFFKVVLPIARPAIFGGLVLVLMEVLNDYGAAKYYGVSTFTTGIFRAWFALEEPNTAVYLSALLLVFVIGLLAIERWKRGKRRFSGNFKSSTQLQALTPKLPQQIAICIWVSIPVVLGFVLPVIQLVYWSILTYADVANTQFITIALQSLGIALLAAFLIVFVALLVLYIPKWNRLNILKYLSKLTILGYAIPGAVIAVGIMIPTLVFDKWLIGVFKSLFQLDIGLLINGTSIALLYAYIIRFLAVAFQPIEGSILKLGETLSESSRVLGKSPLKTFFKIEFPLIKLGVISAFMLVFVDIMKELPLTLILKPYNINTLAVKAYEYASDELIMESALPSLCIVLTGILPVIVLNKMLLKK